MDYFITPQYVLLASLVLLSFCFLVKALALKKEKELLLQQLTQTSNSYERIKKELEKVREQHDRITRFQNSLSEAELTTKLQQPRLASQISPTNGSTPERYRFVHSLLGQGMSTEEIAGILSVSNHEAQQLVTLAKLAGT
jgi:DNA-binding NarL/FixJ family response regulator